MVLPVFSNQPVSLPLEGKMRMNEAREAIIDRLAMELPQAIDLDRFLLAVVKELGMMMQVDRCDVIQLASPGQLRISHEWRASEDVLSSEGTVIPLDVIQLTEHVDLSRPIRTRLQFLHLSRGPGRQRRTKENPRRDQYPYSR